nr:hypothetical protein [Lachnospiraceae bacterium]
ADAKEGSVEKKEETKSEDGDNLGFFKGRRSTEPKNTGMDKVPEPTRGVNHRAPVEVEKRNIVIDDDEDDEVLKKLDKFFENKTKKD